MRREIEKNQTSKKIAIRKFLWQIIERIAIVEMIEKYKQKTNLLLFETYSYWYKKDFKTKLVDKIEMIKTIVIKSIGKTMLKTVEIEMINIVN